ncbi:MAG TPA: hypothetical protein VGE02_08020 [Gemmatimonadales bacterium]
MPTATPVSLASGDTPTDGRPSRRPTVFPAGRLGTSAFCAVAGIGRTSFLTKYRPDPRYVELFDIRLDALGRLNMSERAARTYARQRAGGRPPHGNAGRSPQRDCPHCGEKIHPRRKQCPHCERAISGVNPA